MPRDILDITAADLTPADLRVIRVAIHKNDPPDTVYRVRLSLGLVDLYENGDLYTLEGDRILRGDEVWARVHDHERQLAAV